MMWYMRYPEFKTKAVTFSYDDGVVQDRRLAGIFDKYGMKATFNINGAFFGNSRTGDLGEDRSRLTVEEGMEVYKNHEIALHSYTHPFMEQIPHDTMAFEIVKDRERLESAFGRIIKGMAYPMGTTSDEVVEVLKACGVVYSRTTVQTERFGLPTDWLRLPSTCHHNNKRVFELIDAFTQKDVYRTPELFYIWGHSYEFDRNDNWDRIEDICKKLSGKENVWYATNMEIYEYIEAYKRLKTSADGKIFYNPTNTTLYFCDQDLNEYVVAPGETIRI